MHKFWIIGLVLLTMAFNSVLYAQNSKYEKTNKAVSRIEFLQNLLTEFNKNNDTVKFNNDELLKLFLYERNIINPEEVFYVMGCSNYSEGKYLKSIRFFIWASISKTDPENKFMDAEILFWLAKSYGRILYVEEAIGYYQTLLNDYKSYLDDTRLNQILINLGNSQLYIENFEDADKYYSMCYKNTRASKNLRINAIALIDLGNLNIIRGNYAQADSITKFALDICLERGMKQSIMICYFNLGELNYFRNSYTLSRKNFQHVLDIEDRDVASWLIPEVYKYYVLISYQEKKTEEVFRYSNLFLQSTAKFNQRESLLKAIREINKVMFDLKSDKRASVVLNQTLSLVDSVISIELKEKNRVAETLKELVNLEVNYSSLENEIKLKDEKLLRIRLITLFIILISLLIGYFLLTIIKSKKKIVKQRNKIKTQYEEIRKQKEETEDLNHEIRMQAEEIKTQNEILNEQHILLEHRIEERTKELNLALAKAQESDKLKSAFLQNISHEIRTPLNAIDGFSQLILVDRNKCEEFAGIICENVYDLITIIDNIVFFSKLQIDQVKSTNLEMSISKIIEELGVEIEPIRKKNEKKDLNFAIENLLKEDLILLSGGILLKKALAQLTDNAFKYTDKGAITLRVSKNDGTVDFSVIDTGIGIKEDNISFIFNSFTKIIDEQKLHRGTGIGLALVKQVAKKLNAEILLDTKYGVGTTITLKLMMENFSKA